jgi:hypothetical protein
MNHAKNTQQTHKNYALKLPRVSLELVGTSGATSVDGLKQCGSIGAKRFCDFQLTFCFWEASLGMYKYVHVHALVWSILIYSSWALLKDGAHANDRLLFPGTRR